MTILPAPQSNPHLPARQPPPCAPNGSPRRPPWARKLAIAIAVIGSMALYGYADRELKDNSYRIDIDPVPRNRPFQKSLPQNEDSPLSGPSGKSAPDSASQRLIDSLVRELQRRDSLEQNPNPEGESDSDPVRGVYI